jgi:hypothetical protein
MVCADPCAVGEPAEIGGTIHIRFDFAAHAPDKFRRKIARRLLRTAAQAGAKPCSLRSFRQRKEQKLLWERATGRAGWPAIDSRRTHGIDERTIQARVPRSDGCEALAPRRRLKDWKRIGGLCHERSIPSTSNISELVPWALSESCGQTQIALACLKPDSSVSGKSQPEPQYLVVMR